MTPKTRMADADGKLSFEEFKLYYESTEKVTDRRLETNRWNYSICIAILVAIAAIARFSLASVTLVWVGIGAILVLGVMATLFCALWVGQIRDFKKLNNAKFFVLNEMAPRMSSTSTILTSSDRLRRLIVSGRS